MPSNNTQRAIVLSGGGSRGAFQGGFILSTWDRIKYSHIYGTSAGALNAILLAQSYVDKDASIFENIWLKEIKKSSSVYSKNYLKILWGGFPYSFDPLRKMIRKYVNADSILSAKTLFRMFATDVLGGRTVEWNNTNISSISLEDAMISSANIPPLFPPIEMLGYSLVDGGLRENVPLNTIQRDLQSETMIDIILCTKIKAIPYRLDDSRSFFSISARVIDIMMNEISSNDIKSLVNINNLLTQLSIEDQTKSNKKTYSVNVVEPEIDHIQNSLDFNADTIALAFYEGKRAGMNFLLQNNI